MKKIIFILSTVFFLSCGREAEILRAPKSFNKRLIGLSAFSAAKTDMNKDVRAFTLLFYPRPEDIKNFSYTPDDMAQASWDTFLSTTNNPNRIVQNYSSSMDSDLKVQKIVSAIQAVGRSRDNAWRHIHPHETEVKKLNKNLLNLKEKIEELEPAVNWRQYTCYYQSRPRGRAKYQCKTSRTDTHKRPKRPRGCDDVLTFEFEFEDPQSSQAKDIKQVQRECLEVQDQIAQINNEINHVNDKLDETNEKIEPLRFIRKSGEGVALNILQAAEEHTRNEGNPQIYIATGSSIEKPNNQDILSEVIINWEQKEVEVFNIYIEFGLNYSGGTQSQQYSLANGRVTDMKLFWEDSNPAISFKLHTDDFWIDARLDITNDDPAMGLRLVGEVFAVYPNGSRTRGGMKLEFNLN